MPYGLLLAAAGDETGELPRGLCDLLLRRVARLDRRSKGVLRLAAAAGRDVGYRLLRAAAALPERDVRESLRSAVEHGVLVPEQGSFRFRHALLAEAIYATLLPGEREELHARLAEELAVRQLGVRNIGREGEHLACLLGLGQVGVRELELLADCEQLELGHG